MTSRTSFQVFIMLFMQAILYPLSFADDGTCELHVSRDACLAQPSSFGAGDTQCYWNYDGAHVNGGECYFNAPGNSLVTVVFMAIIASLLGVPVGIFAQEVIM